MVRCPLSARSDERPAGLYQSGYRPAMRLNISKTLLPFGLVLLVGIQSACASPQATAGMIQVEIEVDAAKQVVMVATGSTVQQSIEAAGLELGTLDRVNPPSYTVVEQGSVLMITRVLETFEIDQIIIPFNRQTIRNEALPEGENRLLQPGKNGIQEITYRILIEGGEETSRAPVKNIILEEPSPEIVMIGTQAAHTPLPIEGRFVFVSAGNAWLVEDNSGNRQPVAITGDLDGRILQISPDGKWLLYSRVMSDEEDSLNALWVSSLVDFDLEPIDLGVRNVVHFADWIPEIPSFSITFSTVEPSPAAPGWQANNDLQSVTITAAGRVTRPRVLIESNSGGQYGWWGTDYAWGSDPAYLAYMRADSIGIVDLDRNRLEQLSEITPFQTLSDWAWVPGLAWGHDGQTIYYVDHGEPLGLESPQASPVFNLMGLSNRGGITLKMVERTWLFAYPFVSPIQNVNTIEISYQVAFLQAITPLESQQSNYRLAIMDRDGSNLRTIFPPAGEPGLTPIEPAWSPSGNRIAVMYRGDIWIVDVASGLGQPLTADSQAMNFDWSS
ncbi:MAG: hypothetical protein E4G99_05835 [Anaerolineales bacterium]|nr:MAG: hypothetical protein E4G99_05835 [Anaerolineales bacterium]